MTFFFRNFASNYYIIVVQGKVSVIMFRIPTVTKNLLIINTLCFLAMLVLGQTMGIDLNDICGLHFFRASDFHIYQLFTYMFMHGGWEHIILNMFMLWMFGAVVEQTWGPKRFLFYYIFCGIGAGLCQEVAQYFQYLSEGLSAYDSINTGTAIISTGDYLNLWTTVGASGAIYSLLLAFGMMFPNEKMFIIPIPIPIKAKWMVIGSIVVELVQGLSMGDGVAHMAHLGGMLFGYFLIRYWMKHPYAGLNGLGGKQFFNNLRASWEQRNYRRAHSKGSNPSSTSRPTGNQDWDYNARQQATQEEIDRILDKIRKSGYDSLSRDEKQTLFDQSKK